MYVLFTKSKESVFKQLLLYVFSSDVSCILNVYVWYVCRVIVWVMLNVLTLLTFAAIRATNAQTIAFNVCSHNEWRRFTTPKHSYTYTTIAKRRAFTQWLIPIVALSKLTINERCIVGNDLLSITKLTITIWCTGEHRSLRIFWLDKIRNILDATIFGVNY